MRGSTGALIETLPKLHYVSSIERGPTDQAAEDLADPLDDNRRQIDTTQMIFDDVQERCDVIVPRLFEHLEQNLEVSLTSQPEARPVYLRSRSEGRFHSQQVVQFLGVHFGADLSDCIRRISADGVVTITLKRCEERTDRTLVTPEITECFRCRSTNDCALIVVEQFEKTLPSREIHKSTHRLCRIISDKVVGIEEQRCDLRTDLHPATDTSELLYGRP